MFLLANLPFLLEHCDLIALQTCHTGIKLKWLRTNFLKDSNNYGLQFCKALSLDETAAESRIELSLKRYLHFPGVFTEERKHILINDVETLPELSNDLQAFRSNSDVICFEKLGNFDKSIANTLTFADIAKSLDEMVIDRVAVIDHMCYNSLELKPVVSLCLAQ